MISDIETKNCWCPLGHIDPYGGHAESFINFINFKPLKVADPVDGSEIPNNHLGC